MVVDIGRQGLSGPMHHVGRDQQGGLEDGVKIDRIGVAGDGVCGYGSNWVGRGQWRCTQLWRQVQQ